MCDTLRSPSRLLTARRYISFNPVHLDGDHTFFDIAIFPVLREKMQEYTMADHSNLLLLSHTKPLPNSPGWLSRSLESWRGYPSEMKNTLKRIGILHNGRGRPNDSCRLTGPAPPERLFCCLGSLSGFSGRVPCRRPQAPQ